MAHVVGEMDAWVEYAKSFRDIFLAVDTDFRFSRPTYWRSLVYGLELAMFLLEQSSASSAVKKPVLYHG